MSYLGDFDAGDTIYFKFTTVNTSGVPTALSDGYIAAYKDGSTTETLTGVTLTASFDSRTGLNHIAVDTSQDGTFYAVGSDFQLVAVSGTVGGNSIVGYEIGAFSLRNRANLYPTVAGRTLDVSAGGEAGLDWANIGSPTTAQNLSATNIDVDQVVASVSGNVGGSVASVAAGGITSASIATDAIDSDAIAASAVTEIQSGLATAASIAALNNLSAAQVNAEVDTALADVNLDHLVGTATGIPAIPAGTYLDQVMDDGTAIYDRTTDSLQAIRDRGDAAWITATGFSTLDAAGVRTAVGLASANLDTQLGDLPTSAELASEINTVQVDIAALNNISAAQVNAEVVDVIRTDTIPDSYASDGAQPTVAQAILAIHQFLTEKSVAGTTVSVQKPDGTTTVMTFTLDDATTPTSITRAT